MTGAALVVHADARRLPLAHHCVHCVVTSPPYYGARDYTDGGQSLRGQIGQEPTPQDYLDMLARVLAEIRRVLRPDGTCWVVLGDCYAGRANGGPSAARSGRGDHADVFPPRRNTTGMAPYKSLLMLPERFALAAAEAGWVVRNRIVWYKRNGMRHPVADRLVNLHETVLLLTPHPSYRFDLDAIREPFAPPETADGSRVGGGRDKAASGRVGASRRRAGRVYGATYTDERAGRRGHSGGSPERSSHPGGRNPGDVWDIPTQPNRAAHYAPLPLELARRCVLASSPPGGTVLDPFGGTGTVAAAAAALGRIGVSLDLSYDYSQLARRRAADPAERARALHRPAPPRQLDGQTDLLTALADLCEPAAPTPTRPDDHTKS